MTFQPDYLMRNFEPTTICEPSHITIHILLLKLRCQTS